jgi:hypothetical protein
MTVRVVVRYDKEGRLSSVEVSGDPAAVHQVLSQLLFNQAPHGPAPSQQEPPAPEPAPRQGRKSRASAQQAGAQEGLPEFARDNPWLPLLASRAKQS